MNTPKIPDRSSGGTHHYDKDGTFLHHEEPSQQPKPEAEKPAKGDKAAGKSPAGKSEKE